METLYRKLSEFDLSTRTKNSLKKAGIDTLQELITYTKTELMYFGKRSLMELEELVHSNNLNFAIIHHTKPYKSKIEKLEADKAELLEALENLTEYGSTGEDAVEMKREIKSIIQKHKPFEIK